jgi:hypothetical protein
MIQEREPGESPPAVPPPDPTSSVAEVKFFRLWLRSMPGRAWVRWVRNTLSRTGTPASRWIERGKRSYLVGEGWRGYLDEKDLPVSEQKTHVIPYLKLAPEITRAPVPWPSERIPEPTRRIDLDETQEYSAVDLERVKRQGAEQRSRPGTGELARTPDTGHLERESAALEHADLVTAAYVAEHSGEFPAVLVMHEITRAWMPGWAKEQFPVVDKSTMLTRKIPVMTDPDLPVSVIVALGLQDTGAHHLLSDVSERPRARGPARSKEGVR